jgi:hypothetical protein
MTENQKRRMEDRLPNEKLDWEDPDVKAAKENTRLANAMAVAGATLLEHSGTAAALAAIPDTDPQQYVVAGTLAMIAKVLPAESSVPPLTAPAPLDRNILESLLRRFFSNCAPSLHGATDEILSEFDKITKVAPAPLTEHPRDLIEAVSDFRKATYEFARGQDPDGHARMLEAQKRIFDVAAVKAAPAAPVQPLPTNLDAQCTNLGGLSTNLAAPVLTAVPVPRATLLMIYDAMNHMGDILNNMDACEEEDEEATTPAFDAIRELLDDSYLIAPSTGEASDQGGAADA